MEKIFVVQTGVWEKHVVTVTPDYDFAVKKAEFTAVDEITSQVEIITWVDGKAVDETIIYKFTEKG